MTGKKLVLLGLCLGTSLIGFLFLLYGYEATWQLWSIHTPVPYTYFFDLRCTTAAVDSYAMGFDPLVANPCDPGGRTLYYPRIWLLMFVLLGLNQATTLPIGIFFIILFLVSVYLYLPVINDRLTVFLLLFALFSPAILLGLERANNDLLVFFLLSCAIYLFNLPGSFLSKAGIASLFVAFTFKLYPLFAFIVLLRDKVRGAKIVLILLLGASAYIFLTFDDLALIRDGIPQDIFFSYGMNVIPAYVAKHYGHHMSSNDRILEFGAVIVVLCLSFAGLKMKNEKATGYNFDQKSMDAFRIGSSIYIGTFMLGNNFNYRLMFLLYIIPQLVVFMRQRIYYVSFIAGLSLVAMFFPLWFLKLAKIFNYSSTHFWIDELSDWLLFYGLIYLMLYSAPEWFREMLPAIQKK